MPNERSLLTSGSLFPETQGTPAQEQLGPEDTLHSTQFTPLPRFGEFHPRGASCSAGQPPPGWGAQAPAPPLPTVALVDGAGSAGHPKGGWKTLGFPGSWEGSGVATPRRVWADTLGSKSVESKKQPAYKVLSLSCYDGSALLVWKLSLGLSKEFTFLWSCLQFDIFFAFLSISPHPYCPGIAPPKKILALKNFGLKLCFLGNPLAAFGL